MLPLSLRTLANEEGKNGYLSCLEKLACYHGQMDTCKSDESLMEVLNNLRIVILTETFVCVCVCVCVYTACVCVHRCVCECVYQLS